MNVYLHESVGVKIIPALKRTLQARNGSIRFTEGSDSANVIVFGGKRALQQHMPWSRGVHAVVLLQPNEDRPKNSTLVAYAGISTIVDTILAFSQDDANSVVPTCHAEGVASV
ncbi:MAG: hypothetical protein G01um101425_518 [Candidatus Peregrinibacteria bacterium Gr01-1014_25]|nr:MAG: hypothetical protein G01um101425_518 [Candidatus Peregrinibacteria bacterium Gr01-1014_25]